MTAILITGGARGIGRATAILAGARGWSVTIAYLGNDAAAQATAAAVREAGGRAVTIRGDVAVEGDVVAMFDAARHAFGTLHGVVVNAGIVAPASTLAEMSVERLKRMFDVKVLGGYLCAREASRCLPRSRRIGWFDRPRLIGGRSVSARPSNMSTTQARKRRSTRSPSVWPRSSAGRACV